MLPCKRIVLHYSCLPCKQMATMITAALKVQVANCLAYLFRCCIVVFDSPEKIQVETLWFSLVDSFVITHLAYL